MTSTALTLLGQPAERAGSLGEYLERLRLERRARRLACVISIVHVRASARQASRSAVRSVALDRALKDFMSELLAVEERLRELQWTPPARNTSRPAIRATVDPRAEVDGRHPSPSM